MALLIVLCWCLVASSWAGVVRYDGHRLIRIRPTARNQVTFLRELERNHDAYGLDFWTRVSPVVPVNVRVPPTVYYTIVNLLKERGINFEVILDDIQQMIEKSLIPEEVRTPRKRSTHIDRTRAVASSIVSTFPRHSEINAWLQSLEASYPSIATVINIGSTYEGRSMLVLKLSSNSSSGAKPKIFIEAAIHAREWLTVGSVNYIIDQMTKYSGSSPVQQLLTSLDWYFLPVANPDGYDYTHTGDRLWRKTRTRYTNTSCVGADPNRNWGFHWMESGSSTNPCDFSYGGPRSFSEKCVTNERDFLLKLTNLQAFISLHAYGQMWFVPYAYASGARSADYAELRDVALRATAALSQVQGTQFSVGTPAELLYSAAGGAYDYAKGQLNVKYAYTLELSPPGTYSNGFIVSPSMIVPSGMEVFEAIKVVASYAARSTK